MPRDLAALLLAEGAVSAEGLARALGRQREAGGALDTALLEEGLLSEEALVAWLARAAELPAAPAHAWDASDPRARRVFPSRVAERHGLAPFALGGRELLLVATYPVDLALLDEISFMLSLDLTAHVGPEWRVRELIHRLYGAPLDPRLAALASAAGGAAAPAPEPEPPPADEGDGGWIDTPPPPPPAPAAGFAEGGEELEPLAAALQQALDESEPPPVAAPPPGEAGRGEPAEPPAAAEEEGAPAEAPPASDGAPPDRSVPPRWTLDDARAALAAARDRDEVVLVALRYARDFFEYAAMFAVTRDAVAGHDALGLEDERERARAVAIWATDPGILKTVIETRSPYLGPVTRDAAGTETILAGLGRESPRTVMLHPVLLRDRTVCVLYADNGEAPVSPRRLGDLALFLSGLGAAFERIIRRRKKERRPPEGEPAEAASPQLEPEPEPEAEPEAPPAAAAEPLEEALAREGAGAEERPGPDGAEPPPDEPREEVVRPEELEPAATDAAPADAEPRRAAPDGEAGAGQEPAPAAALAAEPEPEPRPEAGPEPEGGEEAPPPAAERPAADRPAPPERREVAAAPPQGPEQMSAMEAALAAFDVDVDLGDDAAEERPPAGEPPPAPQPAAQPAPPAAPPAPAASFDPVEEAFFSKGSPGAAPAPPWPSRGLPPFPLSGPFAAAEPSLPTRAEPVTAAQDQLPAARDPLPAAPEPPPADEVPARSEAAPPAAQEPLPVPAEPPPAAQEPLPVPAEPPRAAEAPAPLRTPAPVSPPTPAVLADRALDPDEAVALGALGALGARRRDPGIRPANEKLRRALLSGISGRTARAARALGAMRDVEAIPLLIQVLETSEPETANAAADALALITLQRLGPDARRWLAWWKENRGRGRAEWLFSGLTSSDRATRLAAVAELSLAAPPPVPYSADGPPAEREQLARDWAGWWTRSGHVL